MAKQLLTRSIARDCARRAVLKRVKEAVMKTEVLCNPEKDSNSAHAAIILQFERPILEEDFTRIKRRNIDRNVPNRRNIEVNNTSHVRETIIRDRVGEVCIGFKIIIIIAYFKLQNDFFSDNAHNRIKEDINTLTGFFEDIFGDIDKLPPVANIA